MSYFVLTSLLLAHLNVRFSTLITLVSNEKADFSSIKY